MDKIVSDLFDLLLIATSKSPISGDGVLDICGTGGDMSNTFNVSTAAAITCSAVGCKVVKHCGGSISSTSGSTDVLLELGYSFVNTYDSFTREQFGAVHSIKFNPILSALKYPRQELGRPTIINSLAPLLNPVRPAYRVIGANVTAFYTHPLMQLLKKVSQRSWVVCGEDGLDEISTCADTKVLDTSTGVTHVITPQLYGYDFQDNSALKVSSSQESAEIITNVFNGTAHPQQTAAVVLNAAAGLVVSGKTDDYRKAFDVVKYAIDCGMVAQKLKRIVG